MHHVDGDGQANASNFSEYSRAYGSVLEDANWNPALQGILEN
jgi:hypothetical protein